MRMISLALLLLSGFISNSQTFHFKKIETDINSSFRGLSIINDHVAWISGSNGWVGRSTNAGEDWQFEQVVGFEKSDFRSLYAFDDQKAILANAGSPAHILITHDGGKTWKTVYTNTDPSAFFDGIDFWNKKEGLIYGDPIEGKMLLLKTNDGGLSWTEGHNRPVLAEGEASFAASGTGIRCLGKGKAIISTGGMVSRLWVSQDKGMNWTAMKPPIVQGESATGIYSFASSGTDLIVVGGDYTKPDMAENHNLYSPDNGKTWLAPASPSRGYRECVEFIPGKTSQSGRQALITTGPTGTDVSFDLGKNWKALSEETGFHVVRKARRGALVIMGGSKGQISIVNSED